MGEATRGLTVDFVSIVTHEIRTPLTAIQGGASVLRRHWKELPDETIEQLLEGIDRQAGRLNDLVSDLLDLSRLDRGTIAFDLRPLPVDALVAAAIEHLDGRAQSVRSDVPAGLSVQADSRRVRQVLDELLANAVEHGGGVVRVEAAARDGSVEVAVIDDGPGIAAELEPTVFDRFTRSARGDHGGWGLGLAIAREFTEAQGGTIAYERAQPTGARFTLTLPGDVAEGGQ